MAIVLAQGAEVPVYQDQPPVVGAVAPGSPAEQAGIQRGDRILTVAGDEVDTWDDLFIAVGTRPNRDVALTLLRDGQTQSVVGAHRRLKRGSRSATSACCPTSIRSSRRSSRATRPRRPA